MKHAATTTTRYVRVAFVNDLRAAIDAGAFKRENRRLFLARRARIARERRAALRHLTALRALVNPSPPRLSPRERRAALAALDRVEASLSNSGRWDFLKRKLPPKRPSEKPIRDGLRAALQRHHMDATTAAKVIVRQIAPTLPEGARKALLGSWRDEDKQISYLAEKWLRRTR